MEKAAVGNRNIEYSPIKGPEGNIEYLLYLKNHPEGEHFPDVPVAPKEIVDAEEDRSKFD